MALAEDQHPVGDLRPDSEHEPFRVSVRARASGRNLHGLDTSVGQDRIKRRGELSGTVRPVQVRTARLMPLQDGKLVVQDQDLCRLPLCVPKTSSTLCDQAVFVDQAADASLFPDAVLVEIDRLG